MLDPGTALSVVQLSGNVLKLGRDIAFEFFGPEGAPQKLKHLNLRLQTLNTTLEDILKQPAFLESYKSLLSENPSRSAIGQRVLLTVGPDASRIDEFHKKIDQHYTEIGQWRIGSMGERVDERIGSLNDKMHELYVLVQNSIIIPPTHPPPLPTIPNSGPATPEINQQLLSPMMHASPVLRAQSSRTPSLASISELPPPALPSPSFPTDRAFHHNKRSTTLESGSTIGLIGGRGRDSSVGGTRTSCSSLSGSVFGHRITLVIGTEEGLQFSPDSYEVHGGETERIIDWSGPQIRVQHFHMLVPSGVKRIPYTKPNDPKMEVTFLPLGSKHRFEITTPDGSETRHDRFKYQFTHKSDRETFQRRVRIRQSLKMIQVVNIHKSKEENIAMDVHLKVWGPRNEQDTNPTFSFAYLSRKGEKRLILRPYSDDTDLHYGPAVDDSNRRSSTFKEWKRKMSIGSNASVGSRSPPIGSPPAVLYEVKGETAPEYVRKLGYLDIEFESIGLREKFVNACYEAHHPVSIVRRATFGSDTDSLSLKQPSISSSSPQSVSQTTTTHPSIGEHEGVGLGVNMGTTGHVPPSPNPLQLPSPAIPRTSGIRFDLSLFTMPDPAVSTVRDLEYSEPSPTDTQNKEDIR
ncbi:hypothetical protein GQX73_g7928 [Xylaria multiplex]|uniref:Uncharacterized protein n=1 Tax=Xylaria multiplex TaxID=323545 RepID=A0A7C8ISW4_9PEZI|nr:hypothetical protein GQX73_g7928 [Xylaria multiplex]